MKNSSQKIVFLSGHFNVLHAGHLRLLKHAKSLGSKIVVGLIGDSNPLCEAVVGESLRKEALISTSLVDEVIIVEGTVAEVLLELRPHYVLKGAEHKNAKNVEADIVGRWGGEIKFFTSNFSYAISDVLSNGRNSKIRLNEIALSSYRSRRKIDSTILAERVFGFSSLKICVIGDLIVDTYVNCSALGMSAEDPSIVFNENDTARYVGGAGIVAKHCASMGARTIYFGSVGEDELGSYARRDLKKSRVEAQLLKDPSGVTTHKTRYRCDGKTVFRLSRLTSTYHSAVEEANLIKDIFHTLDDCDALIISDFNYGFITPNIVQAVIQHARKRKMIVVGDSQMSSQLGTLDNLMALDLVTPTEREARNHLRNSRDGLAVVAKDLSKKLSAKCIFLKLGPDGMIIHSGQEGDDLDDLPALNLAPVDVSGAGDSLLVLATLSLASGLDIWNAAYMGAIAASVQVSRLGNVPVTPDEILACLK